MYRVYVVGRGLVDIVIEPVGIEELAGAAPAHHGGLGGVVVGEIVRGHGDGQSLLHIPQVFPGQRVGVVFRVPHHKKLPGILCFHGKDAGLRGVGDQLETGGGQNIAAAHLGIAGVGGIKAVVKAPEERGGGLEHLVVEHAEELLGQLVLGNAVMEVKPRLGAPADVQSGVDMVLGPLHDLQQLIPVVHLVKVQILHRGAGDDHPVEVPVLYRLEGGVEGLQMILVRVLGLVAGRPQQLHLNLKRRVGQLSEQLGLGDDLGGHQIENQDAQGADVLMNGAVFRHDENVFTVQHGTGRKRIWDSDGHTDQPPWRKSVFNIIMYIGAPRK